MAIATLELCFQNPAIFDRNVKITKGLASQRKTELTQNLPLVCEVFRRYTRKINKKNKPSDPYFLDVSIFLTQTPRTLLSSADQTVAID